MRVLTALLFLLVLRAAEPRRPGRGGRGTVRGQGRAGAAKRYAVDCKEYTEGGNKYYDCQDRQLTAVILGWPEDIHHLLLARNKLRVLRDNTFSHFRQLKSLDLQQNQIYRIEDDAFAGLDQLTTLTLQYNHLETLSEEVFISLPKLRYLRLYNNPWKCNCQLDSLVRTLQLPSNRMFGNYARCEEPANLKGQKLKKVQAELLCPEFGETVTQMPDGKLPKPPGIKKQPDATSLCHTYLFPKPLLDCRNKDLKNIPADIPVDIVKMDLSRNSIKRLKPREFVAAKDLKLLNLSSNSLDHIDTAAFAGLLYLRELDLSNNSLLSFQYGVLEDLYFLRKLSLQDNPWKCDYNIHYLIYWLKHHPGVDHTGLVCSEPEEFRGWPVEDYVKTYNAECPKDKQVDTGQPDNIQTENTAQELKGETEEEEGLLPSPLRMHRKYEIIRLN
ncbi:leucine-rich repeat-containing protein 17 [Denticeps clupeoides]|uniref:LRRCT domain-containing protein n=1 Tax=Denticeps clupeoides TaxID=299321 RepID=A0AAY4EKY8_9TELE|nr:leucine-rich repeat-containing protein 17 [Denticeps clupeoides]